MVAFYLKLVLHFYLGYTPNSTSFQLKIFFQTFWLDLVVHPGRLTWNLQITHLEKKDLPNLHDYVPCWSSGVYYCLWIPMNSPQGRSLHTSAFAALSNASQRRLGGSAATTASWAHQRAWLLVEIPQDLPDYIFKFKVITTHNICLNKS